MPESHSRPLRVLAVDDWPDTAEGLGTLLRLWGYDVRVARDGAGALREAADFRPDVVLLDIALGGEPNGYEVARRLRAETATARATLICISGLGNDADGQRAQDAVFDHHIVKPADPEILRRLLELRK